LEAAEILRLAAMVVAAFALPAIGLALLRALAAPPAVDADREAFEGGPPPLGGGSHRVRLEGRRASLTALAVLPLAGAVLVGARGLGGEVGDSGARWRLGLLLGLVALAFAVHLRRRMNAP
jgi:hypothetical protein